MIISVLTDIIVIPPKNTIYNVKVFLGGFLCEYMCRSQLFRIDTKGIWVSILISALIK